jgi:hypothetical protein
VHDGADTDGDGWADTLLTDDGTDLLVLTDLDGDGLADRVLRIGPDGSVHVQGDDPDDRGTGSVAAQSLWAGVLGRLLGPGP